MRFRAAQVAVRDAATTSPGLLLVPAMVLFHYSIGLPGSVCIVFGCAVCAPLLFLLDHHHQSNDRG